MIKYPEKVEQLKKSIDVSGKKLLHGNPSDEKIDNQIDILLNAITRDSEEIDKENSRIYSKLNFEWSEEEAGEFIKTEFYKFVGFDKYGPMDSNFWKNFGSAPFYQIHEDKKKKPGIGMDTIFGSKFEECSSYFYDINNLIYSLLESFKIKKLKDKEKAEYKNVVSPYKNLEDLEDNVTVKKIEKEAVKFFMDTTKNLQDRIAVFNEYGQDESYIHHPENPTLNRIFDAYKETGYSERHETVKCLDIIDWWVEELKGKRTFVSYKSNKYHPSLKRKPRNYTPSKASVERLKNYYTMLLIDEGVARFEYDW